MSRCSPSNRYAISPPTASGSKNGSLLNGPGRGCRVRPCRRRQLGDHQRDILGRRAGDAPLPTPVAPAAERPLHDIASARPATQPQPRPIHECRELGQIHLIVGGVERGNRRLAGPAKGLHRIGEPGAAAVQVARRIGDFETVREPAEIAAEMRKAPGVETGHRTGEAPGQIPAALEQMKPAAELTGPRERELLLGPEQLAHAREVDLRHDIVRPAPAISRDRRRP